MRTFAAVKTSVKLDGDRIVVSHSLQSSFDDVLRELAVHLDEERPTGFVSGRLAELKRVLTQFDSHKRAWKRR